MIGEKEARKICEQVFMRCQGGEAQVMLTVSDSALTRFANNIIHQNVAERDMELSLLFFIGKRSGSARTNRTDSAGLDELVLRARENAQASPEDPDHPGLPDPAEYTPVPAYDQLTAEFTPESRASAVGVVCRLAGERNLNASGAFSTGVNEIAIANTRGVFAYHAATSADFQTVVMSDDSSGRAQGSAWNVHKLSVEDLGCQAIQTAERGHNPRRIEPGEYTVVLEHYVTEDMLSMLNFYGMGARGVLEGRSWMNDRVGQQVMDPRVSIWDDGLDPQGIPMPFDYEGVPKQKVDIVKNGVVVGPVYDRYTGHKMNHPSTGHALPPGMRGFGPVAANLFMAAGTSSVAEMIRSTERGLYINRFWFTRLVHPRDCLITVMTRDGVFLIEDGELTYPIKNLRFTQSYVQALAGVEAIGSNSHLLVSEFGQMGTCVPALKLKSFTFTGSTV
jgi:predicted Zn-dependent protease